MAALVQKCWKHRRQLHECIQPTLLHNSKLSSARPITNCLAASNGVCTKRNTAQFGLLLFENVVKNNMTTYPFDKPSYFLFQDSASEVSYACERIIL